MKLALLSYEYPPDTGFGGIGTYTWHQARALARLGHEVHVIAGSSDRRVRRSEMHEGVTVWRATSGRAAALSARVLSRLRMWWSSNRLDTAAAMAAAVRRLEREHRFDAIEMPECGAEGLLVTRIAAAPTVVRLHSPARLIMPMYDVRPLDRWLCARLEVPALRRANAVTSSSRFLRDAAVATLGVRRPIDVLPNGIDVAWFDAADRHDVRAEAGIGPDVPVILFAGRMERRKGIHLCPQIATAVLERHEAAFVFAGRDLFGFLERTLLPALRARPLHGTVHVLGALDLSRMRSWMHAADVVLLPSLWESCPYSCLEAMAAGRAILASDAGGLPELIEDSVSGLLAPSGDSAAFIGQLDRLLADPGLRQRLGTAARRAAETTYRDSVVAERSVAVYRSAAS